MDCTHPDACERLDEDDRPYCAWCEEVDHLRREVAALHAAIKEKAVIVTGGVVKVDGPIGYLTLHGGTVSVDSDAPSLISAINRLPP